MITPDMINGLFELGGAVFLFLNCKRIYRDKCYRGVSPLPFIFFTGWGIFNCYFYPTVNLWYSFAGGCCVVGVNIVFCFQLWLYRKN